MSKIPQLLLLALFSFFSVSILAQQQAPFDLKKASQEIALACGASKLDQLACLVRQATEVVKREIDPRFKRDLEKYLKQKGLDPQIAENTKNLSALYPILIPQVDEFYQPLNCFNQNENLEQLARTILVTSLFLKKFAVYSIGRPYSPLLGFQEVHICSRQRGGKNMVLDRDKSVLTVRVRKGRDNLTPQKLWDLWQDGEAIKPSGYVPTKLGYKFTDDKLGKAIYEQWSLVNPVGRIRRAARIMVYKTVDEISLDLKRDHAARVIDVLKQKLEGRLTRREQEIVERAREGHLRDRISEKIQQPHFFGRVAATHMSLSASSCVGAVTNTEIKRDVVSLISVTNSKSFAFNIATALSYIPENNYREYENLSEDMYGSEANYGCAESTTKIDSKVRSLINVDTVDNLSLSVSGIDRLFEALSFLPQLALLEILKEESD